MRIKELEIELLKARLEAMEARHKAEAAAASGSSTAAPAAVKKKVVVVPETVEEVPLSIARAPPTNKANSKHETRGSDLDAGEIPAVG